MNYLEIITLMNVNEKYKLMKTFLQLLIPCISVGFLYSCGGDDSETPISAATTSSEKVLLGFSISGTNATVNQANKTVLLIHSETDLTALTPTIVISEKAVISPASEIPQDFSNPITYTVTAEDKSTADYLVTVEKSIVGFTSNGKNYEIVKENKTWSEAAAFAVNRGGYLAEIDDLAEQNAIFDQIENSSIIDGNTVSPDGGGASYIWIGGNDLATEGNWIWDGNSDQTGVQFWMGTQSGTPVGGLYTNWGNEPDDFGSGQDVLGIAITDWPQGVAGQWNDLSTNNSLYFLIEFD